MKYFRIQELVDPGTYRLYGEKAFDFFNPELLIALDDLREFFGVPIMVNNWDKGGSFKWRGLRTPEKAKALGAPKSQHAYDPSLIPPKLCNAIDCDIATFTAEAARRYIIKNKEHELLKRIMRLEDGVSWVHFDLRPVSDRIHVFKV